MEFDASASTSSSSSSSTRPTLVSSSTLSRPPFPKSLNHWFPISTNSQPYITSLLSLSTTDLLASSDSESHPLRIYSKQLISTSSQSNSSPQSFLDIPWQNSGRITSISKSKQKPIEESSFIATSSNGLLARFDLRGDSSNGPNILMKVPGGKTPYLCSGSNWDGNLIAAGRELEQNEACVDLWDIRNPKDPLLTFTESHSDDITSLHFLSSSPTSSSTSSHLLTSSTDGLLSIIDTSLGEDEDDSVLSVGNLGASVARAGWSTFKQKSKEGTGTGEMEIDSKERDDDEMTPQLNLPDVWAVSDMQTLGTYNTDGFDSILSPIDVRGPTCLQPSWSTDYVIEVFDSKTLGMDPEEGLKLFCGNQNGGFSIISINSEQSDSNPQPWKLEALFPSGMNGGHCDIVRCVDWDKKAQSLFTGGEDGRICAWNLSENFSAVDQNQILSTLPDFASEEVMETIQGGGKDRNGANSKKDKRYKPF